METGQRESERWRGPAEQCTKNFSKNKFSTHRHRNKRPTTIMCNVNVSIHIGWQGNVGPVPALSRRPISNTAKICAQQQPEPEHWNYYSCRKIMMIFTLAAALAVSAGDARAWRGEGAIIAVFSLYWFCTRGEQHLVLVAIVVACLGAMCLSTMRVY